MAASPWRIVFVGLSLGVAIWIWALAGALFVLRWTAFERPDPPPKLLFPYGEMRIGVDASYPPFAVATADDLSGLDIDLGRALASRLGVAVRFVNMGYDGLYDSLKADQVDIVISALLVDPSRTGDVRYTRHYFNNGLVLISATNHPIGDISALAGRALAYEFGSEADQQAHLWLRRVLPFETQPYELPHVALDAVRLNTANAALVDATSARLYLREHPEWNGQYQYMTDAWYTIAVRLDHVERWEVVNEALESLVEDGTLDTLLARWL
jgi:polar amino acid transport system substrate-binding protein